MRIEYLIKEIKENKKIYNSSLFLISFIFIYNYINNYLNLYNTKVKIYFIINQLKKIWKKSSLLKRFGKNPIYRKIY